MSKDFSQRITQNNSKTGTSLTINEVAELLKVTEKTIHHYINEKKIITYKYGKNYHINKQDFENFVGNHTPLGNLDNKQIRFIDLFAGIGGFHTAFHNLGAKCVFASEIDKNARKTYEFNYKKHNPELFDSGKFNSDINNIKNYSEEIPDFDILNAGFPCQPFSQAGFKKGFEDTRGTLFFTIVQIIKAKQPEAFFLENVRGLLNHNNGETFTTIKRVIEEDLEYSFYWGLVKASDFGLPQHRPRLFMVGFKDKNIHFEFPAPIPLQKTMSDIFQADCEKKTGYTLRCGGRGSGLKDRRNWDCYLVNGEERRLSSKEGKRMQGFPENFKFPVSETQAMKQLGNSVAVPAIQAVAESILQHLTVKK